MKKILILSLIILLVLPTMFALDLEVKKTSSDETMVLGLEKPTIYNLEITNNGSSESISFYTYFTHSLFPKEKIPINQGETIEVELEVYPPQKLDSKGHQAFDVFIKGENEQIRKTFILDVINLEEAFEIGGEEIEPKSSTLNIYIENKANYNFENLDVIFSSAFFENTKKLSLKPYEKKEFEIELNKEDFNKLKAGFYTINAEINLPNKTANIEGTINFAEKNILTSTSQDFGIIINTKIIKKTNEGNVIETTSSTIQKNIFSRLFTTFNPEPDSTKREGLKVFYTWKKELNPGENFEIKVKTNWLFPFIIIILIVTITALAKISSMTNLNLRKRVSFVKTKGGEFALKVSIIIRAKKYIEKVSIIDRLPSLVKVHEKFGIEKPSRIDEKNKKIEWQFEKLEAGETRILSYIIFSKVGLLGKFALPKTTAIFEKEGQIKETESNRTFFMNEASKKNKDFYE